MTLNNEHSFAASSSVSARFQDQQLLAYQHMAQSVAQVNVNVTSSMPQLTVNHHSPSMHQVNCSFLSPFITPLTTPAMSDVTMVPTPPPLTLEPSRGEVSHKARTSRRSRRRVLKGSSKNYMLPVAHTLCKQAAALAEQATDEGKNCVDRFACSFCGMRFQRRYNLKVHMRKHTEEKPYECQVEGCGKRFKWRSSMAHHYGTHKRKKEESNDDGNKVERRHREVGDAQNSQVDAGLIVEIRVDKRPRPVLMPSAEEDVKRECVENVCYDVSELVSTEHSSLRELHVDDDGASWYSGLEHSTDAEYVLEPIILEREGEDDVPYPSVDI